MFSGSGPVRHALHSGGPGAGGGGGGPSRHADVDCHSVRRLYDTVRASMVAHGGVVRPADVHEVCAAIGEGDTVCWEWCA